MSTTSPRAAGPWAGFIFGRARLQWRALSCSCVACLAIDTGSSTNRSCTRMPRVFISDKLEPSGLDLLKQAGLDVDNRPGLKDGALVEALQQADAMIVR